MWTHLNMPPLQNPLQAFHTLLSTFITDAPHPDAPSGSPNAFANNVRVQPSKSTFDSNKPFQKTPTHKSRSALRQTRIRLTDGRIKKNNLNRPPRLKQFRYSTRSSYPTAHRIAKNPVLANSPSRRLPNHQRRPDVPIRPQPHAAPLQDASSEDYHSSDEEELELSSDKDAAFKDDVRKILEKRRKVRILELIHSSALS